MDKVILPKEDLQKGILRETEGQKNECLAVRCGTKCQNDAFLCIFIVAFDISRSWTLKITSTKLSSTHRRSRGTGWAWGSLDKERYVYELLNWKLGIFGRFHQYLDLVDFVNKVSRMQDARSKVWRHSCPTNKTWKKLSIYDSENVKDK